SLKLLVPIIILALCGSAPAVTWTFQYSIPVQTERGSHRAFLWIPPEARHVRGIVIGGMTLAERELVKDPAIRKACADQSLALVFLTCGLGAVDMQRTLDSLAEASGYAELASAPLFFVGHSAGGPAAKRLAAEMADRCFGLMQFRGGTPPGGEHQVRPGIPALVMMGQFDEFGGLMRDEGGREGAWERGRDDVVRFRSADERHLASIAVEPGAGHFAWTPKNAEYLAMFIRKAAEARIPENWRIERDRLSPPLMDIDPKSGWLTDLDIRDGGSHSPAPYERYQGDRGRAAWHFDQEMAEATIAFHKPIGRKDQFIRWRDRHWVDAGARFFFLGVNWVDDGRTFEVNPEYAAVYPSQHNNQGPRWPKAGEPVGNSGEPIRVVPVGGPLVAVGDHRLRIQFDALSPATNFGRGTFLAYSQGNDDYRYTSQVGMLPRGFRELNRGAQQAITFPEIRDIRRNSGPVELEAVSDSDLPVDYYVAHGPAVIEDGKLVLRDIPARATFPIEVSVVAYQFGSGVDPQVRTAAPVERTFRILE
ncbi:MAG: hypothetical protein JJU36_00080, partial [Phycisphaeraceae bacterium]|nr:hypothetical protein [Phycisphaeraceae bacterium]